MELQISIAAPSARAAQLRASTPPPPQDAAGALDWIWGVLLGDFKRDASTGQVVTGMLVTMIPVVDQIADVRDVAANLYLLSKPEGRRDPFVWMALVLTLIGLVPVFGSAAKGVLRLVLNALRDKVVLARGPIFEVIRRAGRGDPAVFIARHLSAEAMQSAADRWFRWVMPKVRSFFEAVADSWVLPPGLKSAARQALTDLDAIAREAPQQMCAAVTRLDEALRHALGQGTSNARARGTVSGSPARATAREAPPPPAVHPEGPQRTRRPRLVRQLNYVPTSGTRIIGDPDRATTILGRWNPDMEPIKLEMQAADMNVGTQLGMARANPGGFNFLNVPSQLAEDAGDRFFELYNAPWLDAAIARGDKVVLATPASDRATLMTTSGVLMGTYPKELRHLVLRGYKPENVTDADWNTIRSWFR